MSVERLSGLTCPRRMSEWGPWEQAEGLDGIEPGRGLVGQARGCTFCGSLSGDDFMALVRAGARVEPTDKAYKAYVRRESPEHGEGKVYFQHLDEAQRVEFVDLLNARRVAVGYPGHFYVLPFFIKPADPA